MTNELESLRKENADLKEQITQLRASCVSGFYYERIPQFSQGFPNHEVLELVTANEVQAYVDKIEELKRQLAELTEWNNQIGRTNYELRKQLEGEIKQLKDQCQSEYSRGWAEALVIAAQLCHNEAKLKLAQDILNLVERKNT